MSLRPGQQVSHYRLIEKIGEGGMGVVWKAEDTNLGRQVAIKVLPEVFARDPNRLGRFEQEARLLASLNHPNIATIHGLQRADGSPLLVMELVPGSSLAELLESGPLPFAEALPLLLQIVRALAAAHERGIVHRDLKPANIKVTPERQVKILDFGLAKVFEESPAGPLSEHSPTQTRSPTRSGVVVGTLNYMSPEQLRAVPLDPRSDLFQLGLVAFEMVTGEHPFPGPTMVDVQHAILRSPPTLERLAQRVPDDFARILAKLLEKEPDYRYPDAAALEVDLRTLRRDSASGVTPISKSAGIPRRRAAPGWAVAVVAAGIVAAGAALLWWRSEPTGATTSAIPSRLVPLTQAGGDSTQPSLSPDGNSVVFASDRGGGWDLWVALIAGGDPVRITDSPQIESDPVWSPDGTRVAFSRSREDGKRSDIFIMPALGGAARKVVEGGVEPDWSADGRWLAYVDETAEWSRIAKIDIGDPGKPVPVTLVEAGFFHRDPAWSPDGEWIVFTRSAGGQTGRLMRIPGSGGRPTAITDDPEGVSSFAPTFTGDGRHVVHSSDRGGATNLWRVRFGGGRPERITTGPGSDLAPHVSRDGRRIAFVNRRVDPRVVVVSPEQGRERVLVEFEGGTGWGPALSPEGSLVAFTRKVPGRPWAIFVIPRSGGTARTVLDSPLSMMWPRFHPDGESLFFFTWPGRQRIGQVGLDGSGLTWLTGAEDEAGYPDVSPDGELLAYVRSRSGDGYEDVVVRSLAGGEERVLVKKATLPRFSPDGGRLAFAGARSFAGGIGVVDLDGGEPRWLTSTGSWPTWMPDGDSIVYADHPADGPQQAWTVPLDGGPRRRLGEVQWPGRHYPFVVDPSTGELITTKDSGGKSTIWLAEYE